MTYAALIQKFLEKIQVIKSLNPAYKKPGDGSNGVCDCIGLLIGAIRRMGLKWTGIHGSNYAARRETVGLSYISKVSELELGDAVYKACDPDGTVRKACNAGKKKRKYDLPDRYKKGKAYYNGDLKDYYHVGTVTKVNPLEITHMTSPHMKVDTNLDGGWNYHGKLKPIVNAASAGSVPQDEPATGTSSTSTVKPATPVVPPSTGSKAIVVAGNGLPVKMREYPSKSCRTWEKVPCGTEVTIIEPGESWAKIDCWKHKGWYMMAQFLDVVGDGKGKY